MSASKEDLLGLAHRRMHNLGLSGERFSTPEQVVGWFGAVQAQDYEPAKWSLASRCGRVVTNAQIDDLVDRGAILRTHVLRPTWQFMLPRDSRWLLSVTGPRVHAGNAPFYRRFGLDEELRRRCETLIGRWLERDKELTRREIAQRLRAEGIEAAGPRLAYIMMSAELNGLVCSGARRGKQQTYALLPERAPDATELDPDEALAEMILRYFTSHGPATVKDLRWWSSLAVQKIRRGLKLVASKLQSEEIDGVTYWSGDGGTAQRPQKSTVHLLQILDEYTVGYSESRRVLDLSGEATSMWSERPIFNWMVLVDGQVTGLWKRTLIGKAIDIQIRLARSLNRGEQRALQTAVESYGRFHERAAAVSSIEPW